MGRSGEAFAQPCRTECREMGRGPLGTSTLSCNDTQEAIAWERSERGWELRGRRPEK